MLSMEPDHVELCLDILESQDELFLGYYARFLAQAEERKSGKLAAAAAAAAAATPSSEQQSGPLAALVADARMVSAAPRLVKACLEDSNDVRLLKIPLLPSAAVQTWEGRGGRDLIIRLPDSSTDPRKGCNCLVIRCACVALVRQR
jgi:hypothetical protein